MKITDIRIVKVESQPFLKAYVTVTFDDELVVHNIRIVEIDGKFCEHAKKSGSRQSCQAYKCHQRFRKLKVKHQQYDAEYYRKYRRLKQKAF